MIKTTTDWKSISNLKRSRKSNQPVSIHCKFSPTVENAFWIPENRKYKKQLFEEEEQSINLTLRHP